MSIKKISATWEALLPNQPAPDEYQCELWRTLYEPARIKHGIARAAAKYQVVAKAGRRMSVAELTAYASSVMKNETMARQTRAA